MKIKCSLAILFAMLMFLIALPSTVLAAEAEIVSETAGLVFSPTLIIAIVSTSMMVIASIASFKMCVRYVREKNMVFADYRFPVNTYYKGFIPGIYDFRGFETPSEFQRLQQPLADPLEVKAVYSDSASLTAQIAPLATEYAQDMKEYRGAHFKTVSTLVEEPLLQEVPHTRQSWSNVEPINRQSQPAHQVLDSDIERIIRQSRPYCRILDSDAENVIKQSRPNYQVLESGIERITRQSRPYYQVVDSDVEMLLENVLGEYARKIS